MGVLLCFDFGVRSFTRKIRLVARCKGFLFFLFFFKKSMTATIRVHKLFAFSDISVRLELSLRYTVHMHLS